MPNVYNYNINAGGGGGIDPQLAALLAQQGHQRDPEEDETPMWKRILPFLAIPAGGYLLYRYLNGGGALGDPTPVHKGNVSNQAIKDEIIKQMNTPRRYISQDAGGTRPAWNKNKTFMGIPIPFTYEWSGTPSGQSADMPPPVNFAMNKPIHTGGPTQAQQVQTGIDFSTGSQLANPRVRGEIDEAARRQIEDIFVHGSEPLAGQSLEQWRSQQDAMRQAVREELARRKQEFRQNRYNLFPTIGKDFNPMQPIEAVKNVVTDYAVNPVKDTANNWWSDVKKMWE